MELKQLLVIFSYVLFFIGVGKQDALTAAIGGILILFFAYWIMFN